jgi:mono/diheme cytochrome c family protein
MWIVLALWSCNFREEKQKGILPPVEQLDGAAIESDFAYLQKTLFNPSCAGCHNTGRSSSNLNLTIYGEIRNGQSSSGRPLLIPGQADASLLYQVLTSGQMPPSGAKPNDVTINLLRCWLEQGAAEKGQVAACAEFRADLDSAETPANPLVEEKPTPAEKEDENTGDDNKEGEVEESKEEEPAPIVLPVEPILPAVTFKAVDESLLKPYFCGDCHGADSPAGNIDLSTYESLIVAGNQNGTAVVPGKPDESLLYLAVASGLMPDDGSPMTGEPKVDSEALKVLRQWILEGAKP